MTPEQVLLPHKALMAEEHQVVSSLAQSEVYKIMQGNQSNLLLCLQCCF